MVEEDRLSVNVESTNDQAIHVKVSQGRCEWMFTAVCSHPQELRQRELWDF